MSMLRSPLSLSRRWTAGALLAATLGLGAVGVQLSADEATTTSSSAGSVTSSLADLSSSGSTTTSSGSGFGAVPEVSSGTGSAQSSTSGS